MLIQKNVQYKDADKEGFYIEVVTVCVFYIPLFTFEYLWERG